MSKDENKDIETVYPWGQKTATYKVVLAILAFNVLALSIVLVAFVEVPALQGENLFLGDPYSKRPGIDVSEPEPDVPAPIPEGPPKLGDIVIEWWWWCILIVIPNIIITYILIRIGRRVWWYEHHCHSWGCHWVKVIGWIIWTITIITAIATLLLIWWCIGVPAPP